MIVVTTSDPLTTQQLALALAPHLFPGAVMLLQGELGSGKTTFVQGLGRGLGIDEPITSPTFIVVQEYESGRLPLFHCDCYRLDPTGIAALGLDEIWSGRGITVIEWPEHLPQWPPSWLWLTFTPGDLPQHRRIEAQWQGENHHLLWQAGFDTFHQQSQGSLR